MTIIQIPVHSFIDVITNSSTEIYVNASTNSVKMATDLIDSILKEGGSDKKATDLFNIYLKPSDSFDTDDLEEDEMGPYEKNKNGDIILTEKQAEKLSNKWRDRVYGDGLYIVISPKSKEGEDWSNRFDFYESEASYNG